MFWEKKRKSEGLPELPPAPMSRIQLPPINPIISENSEIDEINSINPEGLPILPGMENQPMMKFNERPEKISSLPQMREKMPRLVEIEESEVPGQNFSSLREMPREEEKAPFHNKDNKHSIFVKIDKFKTARGSLGNVEEKLEEMNELFKKLREIKVKEDNEIDYIEKELQSLKNRIRAVTEEIFDKSE